MFIHKTKLIIQTKMGNQYLIIIANKEDKKTDVKVKLKFIP